MKMNDIKIELHFTVSIQSFSKCKTLNTLCIHPWFWTGALVRY
jgi:hypothetical protein